MRWYRVSSGARVVPAALYCPLIIVLAPQNGADCIQFGTPSSQPYATAIRCDKSANLLHQCRNRTPNPNIIMRAIKSLIKVVLSSLRRKIYDH